MKLGIGTYCYMWAIGFTSGDRVSLPAHPMSAMALLERARDLDIHLVQFGPNLPLAALDDAALEPLLTRAQAWEIELELGTRGLETAHLRAQAELARRVGSKLLRTVPEIGGRPVSARELPGYLKSMLPILEKDGLVLGLENGHIPARELAQALEALSSPHIGVVLDMVNSMAVSEGWKYVTSVLAPFTVCLHHKDFVVKRTWSMMGFVVEGTPAGQGQLDTPWLLDQIARAGATCNVILELWPPEQPTLQGTVDLEEQWVQKSVQYLRQYIES